MRSGNITNIINITSNDTESVATPNKTFHLLIIKSALKVNPIAENAVQIRDQSIQDNALCEITIPQYYDNVSFVQNITRSITGPYCGISVCDASECHACDETSCENVKEDILDFRNCDCDVVVYIDEEYRLVLSTVAYKNDTAAGINDVKLLALFEDFDEEEGVEGGKDYFGLALNNPVVPAIVAQFTTMSELTEKMSDVISEFTGIDTEIIATYKDSAFLFAIDFEKEFNAAVSFDTSLELGDFAEIGVEDSRLSIGGDFSVENTIVVKLSPDDSDSLKVVTTLSDDNCTTNDMSRDLNFTITVDGTRREVLVPCENGSINRTANMKAALLASFGENETYSVTLVGESSLTLAFNSTFDKVEIEVLDEHYPNKYGIQNDTQTKKPFHILLGKTELGVEIELGGSATLNARVTDYIEVAADVGASVSGSLQMTAGTQELIPMNQWLAKLKAASNITDEFYDANFASASVTVDGNFDSSVEVKKPFKLELPVSFDGEFAEPFVLNLLDRSAINASKPDIILDVELPNIGDIGNLSFAGEHGVDE